MNTTIGEHLLQRIKRGEVIAVRHATAYEPVGIQRERSKCHQNVKLWCERYPGHQPVIGWIITITTVGYILDKHSVIDKGNGDLLDVTPLPDREETQFLPHDGALMGYDSFPNQVIVFDTPAEPESNLYKIPHR